MTFCNAGVEPKNTEFYSPPEPRNIDTEFMNGSAPLGIVKRTMESNTRKIKSRHMFTRFFLTVAWVNYVIKTSDAMPFSRYIPHSTELLPERHVQKGANKRLAHKVK